MTGYIWKLYKTENPRFPYRIAIEEDDHTVIALWTQEKWPGQKGHIFCLREQPGDENPSLELLETVGVSYLKRLGKKVEIVLDRPRMKRCDFLFLKKAGKDGLVREQIFFRTQVGLQGHRAKSRPLLYSRLHEEAEIIIDTREKYPWTFSHSSVRRNELPAGDYALVVENRYAALVERKTFENLRTDLYQVQILHHQLKELSTFPNAALVIEARYSDFSDPARIGKDVSPTYLVRLLGEISAIHPAIRIVYAGNRKLANQWTSAFFDAVHKRITDAGKQPAELMEPPPEYKDSAVNINLEIRSVISKEFIYRDGGFRVKDVRQRFPEASSAMVTRVMKRLLEEKIINKYGKGSGTYYVIGPEAPDR